MAIALAALKADVIAAAGVTYGDVFNALALAAVVDASDATADVNGDVEVVNATDVDIIVNVGTGDLAVAASATTVFPGILGISEAVEFEYVKVVW